MLKKECDFAIQLWLSHNTSILPSFSLYTKVVYLLGNLFLGIIYPNKSGTINTQLLINS